MKLSLVPVCVAGGKCRSGAAWRNNAKAYYFKKTFFEGMEPGEMLPLPYEKS